MPLTPEEKRDLYWDAYRTHNTVSGYISQIKTAKENAETAKANAETTLSQAKDSKKLLKKRLSDVEDVIKLLDGGRVSKQLGTANECAVKANTKFHETVKGQGIGVSSDISTSFRTKSVQDDDDTKNALAYCRSEYNEVSNALSDAEGTITSANETISTKKKSISSYDSQLKDYRRIDNNATETMIKYKAYKYC